MKDKVWGWLIAALAIVLLWLVIQELRGGVHCLAIKEVVSMCITMV